MFSVPELDKEQRKLVEKNKGALRNVARKISRWFRKNGYWPDGGQRKGGGGKGGGGGFGGGGGGCPKKKRVNPHA